MDHKILQDGIRLPVVHRIQTKRNERSADHTLFRFEHPQKIVRIALDLFDTIGAYVNLNVWSNRPHKLAIQCIDRRRVPGAGLADLQAGLVDGVIHCVLARS